MRKDYSPDGEAWTGPGRTSPTTNVVAFLASDASEHLTGLVIPVDAGYSIKEIGAGLNGDRHCDHGNPLGSMLDRLLQTDTAIAAIKAMP